jgi:hypothetical protein
MLRTVALIALSISALAAAEEAGIPPSPSLATGERIWPEPRFTHWPAVMYEDEVRNASFQLPVRRASVAGSVGWAGSERLSFTLPADTDRISGLIGVPNKLGVHEATITISGKSWTLAMRIADARQPWPLQGLENGFPVDADRRPVVLLDHRRDPASNRKFWLLSQSLPRPQGRALIIGDPMEALGKSLWEGIDADQRPVADDRYPQHAVLVALSQLPDPLPRSIVWCPGNQVLFGGAWSSEEERLFGVIRTRCEMLGAMPTMILLLPPTPMNEELAEVARERREQLTRSAVSLSWIVIDSDLAAGPPEKANQINENAFARYPYGEAQARVRKALTDALAR